MDKIKADELINDAKELLKIRDFLAHYHYLKDEHIFRLKSLVEKGYPLAKLLYSFCLLKGFCVKI
jgi:hypothetical protein